MAKEKMQERIPPQSLEAEQSLLGCLLIDKEAASIIFGGIKEEDFYSETHRILFSAMYDLYSKNTPIDFITVSDYLSRNDLISKIGDLSYLTSLTTIVPSSANFKSYMEIISRASTMRKLINAGNAIINEAFEGEDEEQTLSFAEKQIFDIGKEKETSSLEHIGGALDECIDKLDTIYRDPNSLRGLPTGFAKLDEVTNGLQKSDLILVAARPGVGKTSLTMNIVTNAAIQSGAKCAVFSLEMPKTQLAQRMLCSVSNVSMSKVLKGEETKEEWQALFAAKKKIAGAKIFVDDSSQNTPVDILSKCRRIQREHGLDLVMIDYLQLMNSGKNSKDPNRVTEVSDISRSLKIAARELNVPILVLSQLSRAVEGRRDHRPILSDLRESGAIEQDADIVMFIHKPDMYNDIEVAPENKDVCELIIAKHRNGELATINLKWVGELVSFRNLSKDSDKESLLKTAPQKKKNVDFDMPTDADAPPDIEPISTEGIDDIF